MQYADAHECLPIAVILVAFINGPQDHMQKVAE